MHRLPRYLGSATNGLFGLLMGLAGCSASGDDRLAVVVRLDGVTPQITGLEVSAALNGKLASNATMQITSDLSQFVVYLPPTTDGMLDLDIGALQAGAPCQPARAQLRAEVHPAPPRVVELSAALQPASPMQCPLTVNLIGDGTVQASTGKLLCNASQCRGVFAQNAAVTLSAVPGARASSTVAWGPQCPTPGPFCTVTLTQKTQLSATFSAMPCNPNGFCQHNVPASSSNLRGVWSRGASDVWVVGVNGVVLHYDGKAWTPATFATGSSYTFYAVSSTGPNDVVVGGSVTSGGNTTGVIYAYNGSQWSQVASPARTVRDIWLGSPSSGRAVGDAGLLYARNGVAWGGSDLTNSGTVYWSAWGTGGTEYLVGTSGFVATATPGTTMIKSLTPANSQSLFAVWGVSANDIWAVGNNGVLVHYDGTMWRPSPQSETLTNNILYGVWGSAANDFWAVV